LKKHVIIFIAASILIAAVVVSQLMFGKNSLRQQRRISHEIAAYQQQIDSLQQVIEMRKGQIKLLKNDSLYKERILRTRYGMSRKGEVVFQLVP